MVSLGPLTPLPADYLYPASNDSLYPDNKKFRESYANLKTDPEKLNAGGKWWSMFELMKYWHSGILPEMADSNFINFAIDFTAPALSRNSKLKADVDTALLSGIQNLSTNINRLVSEGKLKAAQNLVEVSTANTANRFGVMGQPQGPGPGQPPQGQGQGQGNNGPSSLDTLESLLAPKNIENECINDFSKLLLNSTERFFITDAKKGHLALSNSLPAVAPVDPMVGTNPPPANLNMPGANLNMPGANLNMPGVNLNMPQNNQTNVGGTRRKFKRGVKGKRKNRKYKTKKRRY